MTEELSKAQRWGLWKARFWSVSGSLVAFCFIFILAVIVIARFISDPKIFTWLAVGAAFLSSVLVYVLSMQKKSRYAKCPSCFAPFSLTLIDRNEQLISAVPRQTTTLVSRSANDGTPHYRHDSWVDEFYRVIDTVECDKCGEQFERKYNKKSGSGGKSSTDWGDRSAT